MKTVTFQVLEGVDKGRLFRDLPVPVTIGREEGNILRLNDERVSRFHAKVQFDNDDVILTDLDSTNGTRINGNPVQIRRLRPGDRVGIGRSILMFGSNEEIAARSAAEKAAHKNEPVPQSKTVPGDITAGGSQAFELNADDEEADRFWAAVEERPSDDGTAVTIAYPEWQKIQAVQMLLARYLRGVADPDSLVE